jgi:hypothetical protein
MTDLKKLTNLAKQQIDLEHQVADLEEQIKIRKAALQKVSESDIPEAMDELDMQEFKLRDGRKITLEQSYHAKIAEKNRPVAFSWLRETGHGGVIKRVISVAFGSGEDREARNFLRRLERSKTLRDKEVKDKEDIHPQTLKALMRELKEEGEEFPEDAFGLYVRRYAKIT